MQVLVQVNRLEDQEFIMEIPILFSPQSWPPWLNKFEPILMFILSTDQTILSCKIQRFIYIHLDLSWFTYNLFSKNMLFNVEETLPSQPTDKFCFKINWYPWANIWYVNQIHHDINNMPVYSPRKLDLIS